MLCITKRKGKTLMAEMKNICGKIPVELHEKVRAEIEEKETSTQIFIRQVIEEHFNRLEEAKETAEDVYEEETTEAETETVEAAEEEMDAEISEDAEEEEIPESEEKTEEIA